MNNKDKEYFCCIFGKHTHTHARTHALSKVNNIKIYLKIKKTFFRLKIQYIDAQKEYYKCNINEGILYKLVPFPIAAFRPCEISGRSRTEEKNLKSRTNREEEGSE